jgi:hypothetical protein
MNSVPANTIFGMVEPADDESLTDHFERFKTWTDSEKIELYDMIDKVAYRDGLVMTEESRSHLKMMLQEFADVFAPKLDPYTRAKRPPVKIELDRPVENQPQYNIANAKIPDSEKN